MADRLLADVPLSRERSVRLYANATAARLELVDAVTKKTILSVPLGEATPANVRAATRAIAAVQARTAEPAPTPAAEPLTAPMVRFILGPVKRRVLGAVPLDVVLGILDAMPGWRSEEAVIARPMWSEELANNLRRKWEKAGTVVGWSDIKPRGKKAVDFQFSDGGLTMDAVRRLVAVAPGATHAPTSLPVGTVFTPSLEPGTGEWGNRVGVATPLLRSERAAIVTAPDGTVGYLWLDDAWQAPGGLTIPKDAAFWKWAYKAGFAEAAEPLTHNLDPLTAAESKLTGPRTLDGTGECQWCENAQKLRGGTLVDHGYTYPDSDGWRGGFLGGRNGSCVGVSWRPYEKSCDLLELRLPNLRDAVRTAAAGVRAAKKVLDDRSEVFVIRATKYTAEKTYDPTTDGYYWTRHAESLVREAEQNLTSIEAFTANVERRIAGWTLRPLYDELKAARAAKSRPG